MNRRLQFNLKALFVATAVLAVAASLWRKTDEERVQGVPVSELGKTHVLLGKTHQALGEVTTLRGVVFDGPSKGYDDGPNLCVQMINGRATQEIIHLPLVACSGEFDIQGLGDPPRPPLWALGPEEFSSMLKEHRPPRQSKLTNGRTYEFRGYESGEYLGIPWEAMSDIGLVQTSGFHLHLRYVVVWAKEIPEIEFTPEQFLDHEAVLEGVAKNDAGWAYLNGPDWRVLVDAASPWPQTMVGKQVAVLGTIRGTGDERLFRAEHPHTSLVNPADQVGQDVRLRGIVRSLNDDWWLVCRGTWVYLGTRGQLTAMKFPLDAGPAVLTGFVTETSIPSDATFVPSDEKLRGKRFAMAVRSWEAIDSLFSPELAPVR